MTESQSTNPFLIGGGFEPAPVTNTAEFNPFGGGASGFSSNPFLQGFGAVDAAAPNVEPAATNPFAQFFATETTSTSASIFANTTAQPEQPASVFQAFPPAANVPAPVVPEKRGSVSSNVSDLLGDFNDLQVQSSPAGSTPFQSIDADNKPDKPPPRRPPPPRPSLPRQETKDLILSVTGALEATSSDLLERLNATRTPSPTPLRDLNSPSPTFMGEVNDLLGDDVEMPKFTHGEGHVKHDIQQEAISIFDAIANLSKEEEIKQNVMPTSAPPPPPPLRPPPPQLPIQCESDLTNLFVGDTKPASNASVFDDLTQPAKIPNDIRETPQTSRKSSLISAASSRKSSVEHARKDVESSLTDVTESSTVKPPEIVEETVNQNKSKPPAVPPASYVAARKASHDVSANRIQIIPTHKKYSLDYSSGFFADQNAIKEKFNQYDMTEPDAAANDNKILEAPKFPVISTTPIMSCENITNENLYETEKEPSLIFDEASERTEPFISTPYPQYTESQPPVEDPFAAVFSQQIQQSDFATSPFAQPPVQQPDFGTSSFAQPPVQQPDFTASAFAQPPIQQPDFTASAFAQPQPDFQPAIADPFASFIQQPAESKQADDFAMFEDRFESVKQGAGGGAFDPFAAAAGAFGANEVPEDSGVQGFGTESGFDEFLAMDKPPATFDAKFDDVEQPATQFAEQSWPDENTQAVRPNIFQTPGAGDIFSAPAAKVSKTDSVETPPTPLFDEDVSQPLEPFPRANYAGSGWDIQIRYPIRKKFTGQRFWKKVFVRLVYQGETPHLELINKDDGKETLHHEWPLQPCYAISDIGAQQYDQYGKIFTIKIQFVVYKERPGVRPGQVTKAERLTNKLSQFAAYAIQGDYQGVKEFGSDLKKLGLPVEHSPQISLICKLGSHNYEDMKQFSACVEDALFRLNAHRDNIHINYKMEEVQITAVDELYVEQTAGGAISKQIARVRLFFLGFLTGMPDVEIGVNDLWRQGKEVVGRHDIIPVVTEEWIRLENVEFHSCVQQDVYEETRTIKFKPPDACYLELMRFRVRPPKNRELPLQVKTTFRICGNKVTINSDILVPGFTSRKLGQIPCEDVVVRIPIPECWIYLFRVEKHFRYGSVKSAHRRTGKIKGIERFLGAVDTLDQHLIEVTSGHAKYEHHHRAIVWRMSRLPKEGQGAYTTHNLISHLGLTSYDQIPDELAKHCYVEFTMPITQVSHTTVRSVSINNSDSDSPPEKYVRHLARHEYRVEIEHTHEESTSAYIAATMVKPAPSNPAPSNPAPPPRPRSADPEPAAANSDSDSE